MLQFHPTSTHPRQVLAIPGVPESQARALDRRLKLRRQLQEFRGVSRASLVHDNRLASDQGGPGQG